MVAFRCYHQAEVLAAEDAHYLPELSGVTTTVALLCRQTFSPTLPREVRCILFNAWSS